MPRRTKVVAVTAEGRDKGKTFTIREAPADQAERWANRAILAMANAGSKLPEGVVEGGMAGLSLSLPGIVLAGMRALQGLRYEDIHELLAEMVPLIQYQPPGNAPVQQLFPGDNSQVEEVATWWQLRRELVELHLGFSVAAALSTTASGLENSAPV